LPRSVATTTLAGSAGSEVEGIKVFKGVRYGADTSDRAASSRP
jgi:hypothetical protein